ncbi:hypothetical protein EJB05_35412, partial [Eragrostis curvula]
MPPPVPAVLLPLLAAAAVLLVPLAAAQGFRGFSYLLDCGATSRTTDSRGLRWDPDAPFVSSGAPRALQPPHPGGGLLDPTLATLRAFPFRPGAKYCYSLPVDRNRRYLLRPTFFYGAPSPPPPVFDLLVDGTFWTAVNTTDDALAGAASSYEGVFPARGRNLTFCLGVNPAYTDAGPFISALQVIQLDDSVYNATDFGTSAMGLIARTKFGSTGDVESPGDFYGYLIHCFLMFNLRYPDDNFDRYWQSFPDSKHAVSSTHNVTSVDFWNLPPPDVFNTAFVGEKDAPLVLQWPPILLQNDSYYVALYFADTMPENSRIFDVYINGYLFYKDLNVTSDGLSVFATQWTLSGLTRVTLAPASSPAPALPPLINAGEVFGLFSLGRLTHPRDALALDSIKRSLKNVPEDWNGDPCMPTGYAWTGVTCDEGSRIRVISLNFSSMGLAGTLSPEIAKLTALANISFANNSLSGPIPNLSNLSRLERLHLQDNKLNGTVPQTLGTIKALSELFLQRNELNGTVPDNLLGKQGLNYQNMTFCLGVNPAYTDAGPFISALQVIQLDDSVYNATDFGTSAMGHIARTKFGSTGGVERYPDDNFDRYWQPFPDSKHAVSSTHNVTSADFWNLPPPDVFNTAFVAEQDAPLVLQWPPILLQNDSYYVALYFADTMPENSRIFDVYINDYLFYKDLNVTSAGLSVFATQWTLSGFTRVTLTNASSSAPALPPLINAGEVFGLFSLGRLTHPRDALALDSIKRSFKNVPEDWNGDPCMPTGYAWTGVTCDEGSRIRVISLSFANNSLSGPIPNLSNLSRLERLHLQDNKLYGTVPQTLGTIKALSELFLQRNELNGTVPDNLLRKQGLNYQFLPGNNFTSSLPH